MFFYPEWPTIFSSKDAIPDATFAPAFFMITKYYSDACPAYCSGLFSTELGVKSFSRTGCWLACPGLAPPCRPTH
jgi:hypothetical protein